MERLKKIFKTIVIVVGAISTLLVVSAVALFLLLTYSLADKRPNGVKGESALNSDLKQVVSDVQNGFKKGEIRSIVCEHHMIDIMFRGEETFEYFPYEKIKRCADIVRDSVNENKYDVSDWRFSIGSYDLMNSHMPTSDFMKYDIYIYDGNELLSRLRLGSPSDLSIIRDLSGAQGRFT